MTVAEARSSGAERAPERLARLRSRASDALPSPATVAFGSPAWGLVVALAALAGIWRQNGLATLNLLAMGSAYFYGGCLGFGPALWLTRLTSDGRGRIVRFLAGAVFSACSTHLATAGIFALQYRVYYAHWHADFPSVVWFFQLGFTSAGAVFSFTVASLAFYWPFSCLAIAAFGLWFAVPGGSKAH